MHDDEFVWIENLKSSSSYQLVYTIHFIDNNSIDINRLESNNLESKIVTIIVIIVGGNRNIAFRAHFCGERERSL